MYRNIAKKFNNAKLRIKLFFSTGKHCRKCCLWCDRFNDYCKNEFFDI